MLKVVAPEASACGDEVYPPPERVTFPVGVPLAPANATGTLKLWPELIELAAGLTVTVGTGAAVTVTCVVPVFEP